MPNERRGPCRSGRPRRRGPRLQQLSHGGRALLARPAGHPRPAARDGAPRRGTRRQRPAGRCRHGARATLSRAIRSAPACHARRQRARRGNQCAAPREAQALVPRARTCRAGSSHRDHIGAGRGAPDLLRGGTHQPHEPGQAVGRGHRRRLDRGGHRRGLQSIAARKLVRRLRGLERQLFRRWQDLRETLRARAHGGAARARADLRGLSKARLAAGLRQLRHGASHRRRHPPAQSGFAAHHARQPAGACRPGRRRGPRR